MKIHKIAIEWWEPFPVVKWVLDTFWESAKATDKICKNHAKNEMTSLSAVATIQICESPSCGGFTKAFQHGTLPYSATEFGLAFNTTTIKLLFEGHHDGKPSSNAEKSALSVGDDQSISATESANVVGYKSVKDQELVLETLKSLIENITTSSAPEKCQSPDVDTERLQSSSAHTAVVKLNCNYDSVRLAVKKYGLKESKGNDWDVYWTSQPIPKKVYAKFMAHQRANRFPKSELLISKNNLAAYLNRMSGLFPCEYDFYPRSWSLPKDWLMLESYALTHPNEWIIVKPHNGCGGRGIYLTQDVSKLRKCRKMQGQLYIQKPFLIDGLKFDLRIYVLLPSCEPLRIFVYNEALVRFATVEYVEPNDQNKHIIHMHLTNYSLNKHSPRFVVDETRGTLRRFSTIKNLLNSQIPSDIDDVVIKTIIAMLPTLKYNYRTTFPNQSVSCFQIFGFDVMFDRNLKAYVLEVNSSPSLQADVPLDIEMTNALVLDTFNILRLNESFKFLSPVSTSRRIEWENSHMGNYRRIYPNGNTKRYHRFMDEAAKFILVNSLLDKM